MQRYCTELTERLLKSLDKEYNVVDMGAVVDVITALEKTTITKEVLEITRLGKYINELRRKTSNDALAKRAKDLVRRWRDMVLPSSHSTPQPTPADTAPQALNGTKPQSPALRGLKPHSPAAIRALKPHSPALKAHFKPQSPLLRDSTPFKQVLSPALSLHSDKSRSPNAPSARHNFHQPSLGQTAPTSQTGSTTTNTTNHRPNTNATLGPIGGHNHTIDPVPRTHSSNKRLRKDDALNLPTTPPLQGISGTLTNKSQQLTDSLISSRLEPPSKRPRLNGETLTNIPQTTTNNNVVVSRISTTTSQVPSLNQQVPSPRDAEKSNDRLSTNDHGTSSNDLTTETIVPSQLPSGPKKRGRKKGSKSVKSQALPEDRVKEKLASISRNPKLKTTQELLADLQARGTTISGKFSTGTTTTNIGPSSRDNNDASLNDDAHRNSNDDRSLSSRINKRDKTSDYSDIAKKKNRDIVNSGDIKRWENSTKNRADDDDEDDSEHDDTSNIVQLTKELTVEEILAKLPPIDIDSIVWSDCDDNAADDDVETTIIREITDSDVDKLHNECVEGLNGNFQAKIDDSLERIDGASVDNEKLGTKDDTRIMEITDKCVYGRLKKNNDDREFREWHEMLAKPSVDGQILHILPYVIID